MTLYDNLPDTLNISGVEYPIDTDFRPWVRLYIAIMSGKSDDQKARVLAEFIQGAGLPLTLEAVEAVTKFFSCNPLPGCGDGDESKEPVFDFDKDSQYIYSAFLDVYNIDLSTEKLHWFAFISLFRSLPEDCQICKIMHYRAVKLSDVPKSQRKFYKEMKERYALNRGEKKKTLQERNAEWKKRVDDAYRKAKMQVSVLRSGERSGNV